LLILLIYYLLNNIILGEAAFTSNIKDII
jgi:hypothetical protein